MLPLLLRPASTPPAAALALRRLLDGAAQQQLHRGVPPATSNARPAPGGQQAAGLSTLSASNVLHKAALGAAHGDNSGKMAELMARLAQDVAHVQKGGGAKVRRDGPRGDLVARAVKPPPLPV
jgi:hypothetical protein